MANNSKSNQRFPRNAAPMPFQRSFQDQQQPVLSGSSMSFASDRQRGGARLYDVSSMARSPSSLSEIEVVLDDGTLQKRTVSLSTLPDLHPVDSHESSHSAAAEEGDSAEPLDNNEAFPQATTPLFRDGVRKSYQAIRILQQPSSSSNDDSDSDSTALLPASGKRKKRGYRPRGTKKTSVLQKLKQRLVLTPEMRQVLKCSFAYFLGSLFTFIPALNALIGNNRVSSHLVATATVFFNPAKSLGGMMEAAMYGWGYVSFALFICLGSMITTDFFVDRNYEVVAHTISLVFWLAGATFVVSFLKAHWNKPPVATASSLCFIIIFIIVVREGSANKGDFDTTRIEQITTVVATGTLVTVSCCVAFWPYTATKKLRMDLIATLKSYSVLLKLLTKTFLLDDDLPEFTANKTLQAALDSHRKSFTSLQKSLKEAKLEALWNTQIRGLTPEYEQVVKSMQRLAQHVGGLRSSCGLQFERMSEQDKEKRTSSNSSWKLLRRVNGRRSQTTDATTWNIKPGYRRRKLENEMRRQRSMAHSLDSQIEEAATADEACGSVQQEYDPSTFVVGGEDASLSQYFRSIRKPIKSLAYTCKQTIRHLQSILSEQQQPVAKSNSKKTMPSLEVLESNLSKAIELFEESQLHVAAEKLHRMRRNTHPPSSSEGGVVDNGPLMGEDVFLVYFFVFNMIEFANEMINLVRAVRALREAEQDSRRKGWRGFVRWWREETVPRITERRRSALLQSFIPNERNKMNTLHTPEPSTKWRKFFLRVWRTFSLFKLQKMRYAIKASIAATLLATPAFLDSTGAWFREWRMEWALITLMVVMTPTVGGTNLVAVYRILSTALGCFTAMCFYLMFPGNMYVLPIVTWLFSIPNFWLILNHKHGKFGQFTLLAYNLVMLNKYNDRDTNNIEVWRLALQRCVAILVGVVFGLVATAYIWPYEARVELRKGLSDFLLQLAWLYQRLVSAYSSKKKDDPTSAQTDRTEEMQLFMDMELKLQRSLLSLQDLLTQTPNEPRLKGPFPAATYRAMLGSCQNIVDKFLSMRGVILKEAWVKEIQKDFVVPASAERRELVGNILLYFYLLASALRLKTPLPPYLPPARAAWQSLILRLRQLPVTQSNKKEQVYIIYYAYVTMMEDVIRELDKLGHSMTLLFGALVPADQWERLFEPHDIEQQAYHVV